MLGKVNIGSICCLYTTANLVSVFEISNTESLFNDVASSNSNLFILFFISLQAVVIIVKLKLSFYSGCFSVALI